ncbi:MAG: fumarate hydratase, partial [Spirochaetaceae bacterium]|nr:fumarate hydratase [Spirochaetaceae bacterium]
MNTRRFSSSSDYRRRYSCISASGVQSGSAGDSVTDSGSAHNGLLRISGEALETLAFEAFSRLSFTFTEEHLHRLMDIARDRQGIYSDNDRYTSAFLLKNALTASQGILPLCQDTGIAAVFGWKGARVITGIGAEGTTMPEVAPSETASLTRGIERAYRERNLRFSTVRPSTFFDEYDPGNNLPAQLSLFSAADNGFFPFHVIGDEVFRTETEPAEEAQRYRFLFCAKGGGSSNKTSFTQGTKALLAPKPFEEFLEAQIRALGTAACPPYTIAVVVGGLSPEQNLLALKLATAGLYDDVVPSAGFSAGEALAESGFIEGQFFRDVYWEGRVLEIAADTGLGAQFGGRALAVDAIVLRLPRHGASCPISVGVSCSAHRNLRGFIDRRGIFLEETVGNPAAL